MPDISSPSFCGCTTEDRSKPRVLVIIPAYNEEEAIVATVNSVKAAGYDYVVINDGSTDNTLEICHQNKINVLDLPQNLGIGGAVQTGHLFAQRMNYDIDIQFDGDGQHDARFLNLLVDEILHGANLAIGSRFIGDTAGFKSSPLRRLGKTWLSLCLRLFSRAKVSDPTSGFRACDRKAIDLFCNNYPVDYPEPESIAVASRHGLRIKEIPVEMHERQGGVSSIGPLSSIYFMIKVTLAIIIASVSYSKKGA